MDKILPVTTPMTVQKTGPLVLLMFTVLCALPPAAAVGVIPSAIAQEEGNDDQDLSSDDDTNTQTGVPMSDQDQGAANLGSNLAANLDVEHIIEETRPTPTPTPPEEEEPPESEVFCFSFRVGIIPVFSTLCFSTEEGCNTFLAGVSGNPFIVIVSPCDGFETPPPGAVCLAIDPTSMPPELRAVPCEQL